MKAGDLVEVLQLSSWGGISRTGQKALLLRRLYLGYEARHSKWEIMVEDGTILISAGSRLKTVARANTA